MSTSQKIAIVGTQGTGKTVFLAVLANALSSARHFPRITGENMTTRRYTAEVMDILESGQWPALTRQDVKRELKWLWYDRDGDPHSLGTFDCAGEDFRAIFEAEHETELNDYQRALKAEFRACDLVLLLLNLQDALDIYQKPGKGLARIDIEYAPSAAVRQLRKDGITLYAIFTQADRYEERIQREWNGDYSNALRDLLPDLYNALEEAGSQFAVVRAVETEEINGHLQPKKERNAADLTDIVQAVDAFFAKRKEEARQRELAVKEEARLRREEEECRLREEAERQRQQAKQERLEKEATARREARIERRWNILRFFVIIAVIAAVVFSVMKYNAVQERKHLERVAREEKAAAERKAAEEAKKRAEEERIRAEKEEAERKAEKERVRIEKEEAERKAAEEKAAEEAALRVKNELIRIKNIEMERKAAENKAAIEAKKRAEEERIRAEKEEAIRRAEEEKAAEAKKQAEIVAMHRAAIEKARAEFSEKLRNYRPFRIPNLNLDMQPIKPGVFVMGSPDGFFDGETGRGFDEKQHRVALSKPYWLGKFPVTQGQWEAVMGTNVIVQAQRALKDDTIYLTFGNKTWREFFKVKRDANPAGIIGISGSTHPMTFVSWKDAKLFCEKLTERERSTGRLPEGYHYTLPTESQWEYACRAGTTTPFNTGYNLTTMQANYNGNEPYDSNAKGEYRGATTKVGTFPANAWGLHDMHGNVWEWCLDWYGDYPPGIVTDPTGPALSDNRVSRGGSWGSEAQICRSASRGRGDGRAVRSPDLGFRLALSSVGN